MTDGLTHAPAEAAAPAASAVSVPVLRSSEVGVLVVAAKAAVIETGLTTTTADYAASAAKGASVAAGSSGGGCGGARGTASIKMT